MLASAEANLFMATFTPSHPAPTLYVTSDLITRRFSRLIGELAAWFQTASQGSMEDAVLTESMSRPPRRRALLRRRQDAAALGNVRYSGPGSGSGLGIYLPGMFYTHDPGVQHDGCLSKVYWCSGV